MKDTAKRMRAQTQMERKHLHKPCLMKGCYPKYTKEHLKSARRKQLDLISTLTSTSQKMMQEDALCPDVSGRVNLNDMIHYCTLKRMSTH